MIIVFVSVAFEPLGLNFVFDFVSLWWTLDFVKNSELRHCHQGEKRPIDVARLDWIS